MTRDVVPVVVLGAAVVVGALDAPTGLFLLTCLLVMVAVGLLLLQRWALVRRESDRGGRDG